MTRDEVYKKLNEVFHDVFDNDQITLSDATTAKDIQMWDSLMHVTLISEIEDAFNIRFNMKDIPQMNNVGQMVDKIVELVQ